MYGTSTYSTHLVIMRVRALLMPILTVAAWRSQHPLTNSNGSLTLSVYNNTAMAGAPYMITLVSGLSFSLSVSGPTSVELTGTLSTKPSDLMMLRCDFGNTTFAMLHIDDHLVCQQGANVGDSCGTPNHECNGTDSPLPVLSKTSLPIRLAMLVDGARAAPVLVKVELELQSGSAPVFTPELPPLEVRRRSLQRSLLDGWGMFYAMSYLDHVLLPHAARIKLAICQVSTSGNCVQQGRIDWQDATGLEADIRLGIHAYDRSYNQLYIGVGGCNISIRGGGGRRLLLLAEIVPSVAPGNGSCDGLALVPVGLSTW